MPAKAFRACCEECEEAHTLKTTGGLLFLTEQFYHATSTYICKDLRQPGAEIKQRGERADREADDFLRVERLRNKNQKSEL